MRRIHVISISSRMYDESNKPRRTNRRRGNSYFIDQLRTVGWHKQKRITSQIRKRPLTSHFSKMLVNQTSFGMFKKDTLTSGCATLQRFIFLLLCTFFCSTYQNSSISCLQIRRVNDDSVCYRSSNTSLVTGGPNVTFPFVFLIFNNLQIASSI